MPPKEEPLAHRIHTDPALREIIKLVGYRGMSVPITNDAYGRLRDKFGKERLVRASEELVDIDTEKKLATLKAEVRKLCQAILGPAPENWTAFYEGIENPPPNPYLPPPTRDMSSEALIRELDDAALQKLLEDVRAGLNHHGARSRQGRILKKDVKMAEAEIARRAKEIDLVAHAVADAIQEETGMGCEVTPVDNQVVDKKTAVDNPEPFEHVGFIDFSKATTHRLRELLDMMQYEVAKNEPDSVTYEEALRDIGLIETELRRRNEPDEAEDAA